MPEDPAPARERVLCEGCGYAIGDLPVSPGGLLMCPECGRRAVPGTYGRPELRVRPWGAAGWVGVAFAIGLLPLVLIGIDVVIRFGAPRQTLLEGGLGELFGLSPCMVVLLAFPLALFVGRRWQRSGAAWPGGLVGLILAAAIGTSVVIWVGFVLLSVPWRTGI